MSKIKHFRHSYAELAKNGRKYYNDDNFCTVIGLAVACDLSFGKAYNLAKRTVNRSHRRGLKVHAIHKLYESMGKVLIPCPSPCKTLSTLKRSVPPTGRYMFLTASHCAVSRDGIVEDWCADNPRRLPIQSTYKIEDIT